MAPAVAGMAALPVVGLDTTLDTVPDTRTAADANLTFWVDSSAEAGMRRVHIVEDSWPCYDAIDWRTEKKAEGEGRRGQWDSVVSTE